MKSKLFVSACFYALLLIFLVATTPSEGLGAIWNGDEEENKDGCSDGIESHCGKGYVDVTWQKDHTWGTGWQTNGGKGGGSGKGSKGGKGGGGGYKIPIPGVGKGGGGKL